MQSVESEREVSKPEAVSGAHSTGTCQWLTVDPSSEVLISAYRFVRAQTSCTMVARSFATLASAEVYDVAIVGAGMVGAAVAALLSKF